MNKYVKIALDNMEIIIASIFIVITTSIVLVNVFLRYFMHTGLYWSEEVATSCFVWCVFIGSAGAYRNHAHLGVDLVVKKLPKIPRMIVEIIVDLILIVLNAYILYLSVIFVSHSYVKPTAVLGVSSAWVSSSLIVSFGLTTIYAIKDLIQLIVNIKKGEEV